MVQKKLDLIANQTFPIKFTSFAQVVELVDTPSEGVVRYSRASSNLVLGKKTPTVRGRGFFFLPCIQYDRPAGAKEPGHQAA